MSLPHDVIRKLQHHPQQVRCRTGLLSDRSAAGLLAAGRLPDVMDSGIHGVRTHWIRGFMAFQLARRIRDVMLMVPV
jgi:hypothetical protein